MWLKPLTVSGVVAEVEGVEEVVVVVVVQLDKGYGCASSDLCYEEGGSSSSSGGGDGG